MLIMFMSNQFIFAINVQPASSRINAYDELDVSACTCCIQIQMGSGAEPSVYGHMHKLLTINFE